MVKWEDTKHWSQVTPVKSPNNSGDLLARKTCVLISKVRVILVKRPTQCSYGDCNCFVKGSRAVPGHSEHCFLC